MIITMTYPNNAEVHCIQVYTAAVSVHYNITYLLSLLLPLYINSILVRLQGTPENYCYLRTRSMRI